MDRLGRREGSIQGKWMESLNIIHKKAVMFSCVCLLIKPWVPAVCQVFCYQSRVQTRPLSACAFSSYSIEILSL